MALHIDNAQRAEILTQALPYIKKYNGKVVVIKYGGNAMVNDHLKEQVMEDGLRLKFADPELRKMLISTHPHELIAGTTWHDNEWGNCSCERCKNIPGKNKLGKILMKLRAEFMEEK